MGPGGGGLAPLPTVGYLHPSGESPGIGKWMLCRVRRRAGEYTTVFGLSRCCLYCESEAFKSVKDGRLVIYIYSLLFCSCFSNIMRKIYNTVGY